MITSQDIVDNARKYRGTPFTHQGRSPAGVDCAGLAILAHSDLGLSVVDVSGYTPQPGTGQLKKLIETLMTPCRLQHGCVVVMRFLADPQHIGIISHDGAMYTIIHAYSVVGKVVEHTLDSKWMRRIVACYKHPEVSWQS
jgi:cell wall-associated NlpC family hydrolase